MGFISLEVAKSILLKIRNVFNPPHDPATKNLSTNPSLKGGFFMEETISSVSALLTKTCSGAPNLLRLENFVCRGRTFNINPRFLL